MDFTMTETITARPALGPDALRAEDIFRRYPDISRAEIDEANMFLKNGRHIDIGLVTGNPEIKANVDAFRQEHRRALSLGWGEMALFTAFFVVLVGAVVWMLAK